MKFTAFKEFKDLLGTDIESVKRYLVKDLKVLLRELQGGLTKLSFEDNFKSFTTTVTIPASSELAIRNELRTEIPTKRIIVRGGAGSQDVVDGDTTWNRNFVYLKNTTGSPVTLTVLFTV